MFERNNHTQQRTRQASPNKHVTPINRVMKSKYIKIVSKQAISIDSSDLNHQ